jgi:hypothetical protein
MSHFSRIKTKIVEKELLIAALKDLGYEIDEGELSVKGFGGNRSDVEIRAKGKQYGYDIGFQRSGDTYDIVADWFGVRGTRQKDFTDQLNQRYAYHATRVKLETQGFALVDEVNENGQIRLLLRRLV